MRPNNSLEHRIADLIDMADNAGQGRLSWEDFTRSLVEVVPGSIGAFIRSSRNPASDALLHHGYDPGLLQSYNEHFGKLNPWNAFWQKANVGNVYASSRVWPSRTLKNTEFYNDWLMKLDHHADGIGIKLGTIADTMLSIVLHLPDKQLQESEEAFERVLSSLAGPLVRAVDQSNTLQRDHDSNIAEAALVDRDADIAVVIDPLLNVVEANATAESSFRFGGVVTSRMSKLSMASNHATDWLKNALMSMTLRRALDDHRCVVVIAGQSFMLSVFPLPGTVSGANLFQRSLFLLLVRNLSRKNEIDGRILSTYFRLSPAEIRMCAALAEGITLNDAATRLGITRETARDRLKKIFHRTGLSRQVDLVTLLLKIGYPSPQYPQMGGGKREPRR